ncbi:MAG: polysaccharide pyruvyl transferase family protein, partial [Blastocatellia bacterium]
AGVAREVEVVPDTALLLAELFSEAELEQRIQALRSEGVFPTQGRTFTFQMPLMAEPIANEAAAVLSRLKVEFPEVQIVLLPVGTCRNDLLMVQRIKSRLGAKVFVVDRETSILDVISVISHSHCFAGASLHGNITAAAYALENVFINIPECAASKNREYAKMLGRESCLVEDLTQLYPTLRSLYAGECPVDVSVLSALKKRSSSHFDRLASKIASDIAAPAGKTRSVCLAEVERIHSELCESLSSDANAKAEKQRIKTESRIQEAEARASSAAESAERMKKMVVQRETEARRIQESRGWRLLSRYGRFKHRVLLPAARRLGL